MNVNDLFPSRFVKAHDLGGKAITVVIRAATLEELGYGAEKEQKLALAFEKAQKMMLLNRTNAMIIAQMYGPETDGWIGKAITIYSARVKAFGAWHDALRIKEQIPARNTGAAKMPEAMVEAPPIDDEEDVLDVDEGNPLAAAADTSAYEDPDVLFMPDTGPERATQEQLDELDKLGIAYYDADIWPGKLAKMVEAATTGHTSAAAQLQPHECRQLLRVMRSRMAGLAQSTDGAKQPVANGTVAK